MRRAAFTCLLIIAAGFPAAAQAELVNRIVPLSLIALVESIGVRNDPEMVFTARVTLKRRR